MAISDKTLPISFREDEMWMKREIMKHSSKSGFVKDVLSEYFERNGIKPDKQQINNYNDNSVPVKTSDNFFSMV